MKITIEAVNRSKINVETGKESRGFRAGDLVFGFYPTGWTKGIIVGVDNKGIVWTVGGSDPDELKNFRARCWLSGKKNEFRLIKRPIDPDLTVEGLKKSLKEFIGQQ